MRPTNDKFISSQLIALTFWSFCYCFSLSICRFVHAKHGVSCLWNYKIYLIKIQNDFDARNCWHKFMPVSLSMTRQLLLWVFFSNSHNAFTENTLNRRNRTYESREWRCPNVMQSLARMLVYLSNGFRLELSTTAAKRHKFYWFVIIQLGDFVLRPDIRWILITQCIYTTWMSLRSELFSSVCVFCRI